MHRGGLIRWQSRGPSPARPVRPIRVEDAAVAEVGGGHSGLGRCAWAWLRDVVTRSPRRAAVETCCGRFGILVRDRCSRCRGRRRPRGAQPEAIHTQSGTWRNPTSDWRGGGGRLSWRLLLRRPKGSATRASLSPGMGPADQRDSVRISRLVSRPRTPRPGGCRRHPATKDRCPSRCPDVRVRPGSDA